MWHALVYYISPYAYIARITQLYRACIVLVYRLSLNLWEAEGLICRCDLNYCIGVRTSVTEERSTVLVYIIECCGTPTLLKCPYLELTFKISKFIYYLKIAGWFSVTMIWLHDPSFSVFMNTQLSLMVPFAYLLQKIKKLLNSIYQ